MSKHTLRSGQRTIVNPRLEHKDGEWVITYSYRDQGQGRTYSGRERLGPIDRDEARVAFGAWQATQVQLTRASAVRVLNEILDPYEAMLLAKGDPKMTYLNNIRFMRPLLGHTPIALIDTRLLNALAKARDLKPVTLRSYVGALNAAMQFAAHEGLLTLAEQRRFKLPPRSQPRDFYLQRDEVDELLTRAHAESEGHPKLKPITLLIALAVDTGARRGALIDLTWDRVDLKANTIDFRIPGRTVVNKKRVKIKIFKRLRPTLERGYGERGADTEPVFTNKWIGEAFVPWVQSIEWERPRIAKAHLHALRHTFATRLIIDHHAPLDMVASLLGDSLATVSSTYAHLRASDEDFDL
jgi:integrase